MRRNFEHSCDQVTFRMALSKNCHNNDGCPKRIPFSLVWVMEFNIISPCLGKVKVFSNATWQSQLTFNVAWKRYDVYFAVPHCFIKVLHLQPSFIFHILFYLFICFLPFKLFATYPQEKSNRKESHAYLIGSQYWSISLGL